MAVLDGSSCAEQITALWISPDKAGGATMRRIFLILLGIAFCPLLVCAQGQTAEVTGTVTDESGAIVANVAITITNAATGVSREAKTNASGIYDAPSLQPGQYTIRVTFAGFQTAVA